MTDQTIPADQVREIAARFRNQIEPHIPFAEYVVWERAAEAVEALLPTPPRPTLADMTEEERRACQWMQADVANRGVRYVIATPDDEDGDAELVAADGNIDWILPEYVTPRPDLPRMEWPGDQKPAPALPEGWRLADHKGYGRGIVTNPTPNRDGHVYFVIPDDDPMGYEWVFCTPDDLTYLDQEADQ